MISIFCQDCRTVTIRRNSKLIHLANHCLLDEKNEILPQNDKLFAQVGRLLCEYGNNGIGQNEIESNTLWCRDRLFEIWNGIPKSCAQRDGWQDAKTVLQLYQGEQLSS